MNVLDFKKRKKSGQKISMVTVYDYTSACIAARTDIDVLLVGDSAAMTMHGFASTLPATIEMMELHSTSVARAVQAQSASSLNDAQKTKKFVVADLPFLSYRKDLRANVEAAERLMRTGAHAVKLEGAVGNEDFVRHLVESGVPVMGHIGLTPQSVHQLGGFRVQGREVSDAERLLAAARSLEEAGAFSIVLECVPSALARQITQNLSIPTIGIGAGPDTDGQVLVWQDLLGLNTEFRPRFVRSYCAGAEIFTQALNSYARDVSSGAFPSLKESYE